MLEMIRKREAILHQLKIIDQKSTLATIGIIVDSDDSSDDENSEERRIYG